MTTLWKKLRSAWKTATNGLTEAHLDFLRGLALVAGIGLIGLVVYYFGRPFWRRRENHLALAEAQTLAEKKDYHGLLLALRRAVLAAPQDAATWRQVVQDLAGIASPETVLRAREQLIRLTPQDVAVRIALVEDALRVNEFESANAAMAGFDDRARHDVAFYRLAVAVATAEGRSAELPGRLAALVAADPADLNARFTLAAIKLWNSDARDREEARAELRQLAAHRDFRVRAAIQLLTEAARDQDRRQIQQLLTWLLEIFAPGAAPDFSEPTVPGWTALVQGIQTAAAAGPASDAALVARWLADLGRRRDALTWLESLPAPIRDNPLAVDTAAELAAEEQDLALLDRLLRDGAWGRMPDAVRLLALSAHIELGYYDGERGRALWRDAISTCGTSQAGLQALVRLADAWHDANGSEGALRRLIEVNPRPAWPYEALRTRYTASGDLQHLWELYGLWARQMPGDSEVVAQSILLSCVLNQGLDAVPPPPADSLTGTLARAALLWRQQRPLEARKSLSTFTSAQRRQPAVAFWVALVAADLGRRGEALAASEDAQAAPLPGEENALLEAALLKVNAQTGNRKAH